MSNAVKKIVASLAAAVLFIPYQIFADVAPDPVVRTFNYLPVILVAVLVIVILLLIKKFFKK